ncbi:MAG: hypothetical protein EAX91_14820 [Candidatus Lokiarchaeota archaeon]|nr:hypothetical protein [Candidatus Lokiarchaeota archaeon]
MLCIHGLDNNNCPICRMTKSTIPQTPILNNAAKIENLRPENPFFKKYLSNKNQTEEDINISNKTLQPNLINPLPTPNLINRISNLENKEFAKKLNDLDINRLDKYGVSKRNKLENPNLKLDDD